VAFPHAVRPYSYRTEYPTIKVGDEVLVPVGDKETIGTVVSVGQYMRIAAPYPVDKTKFIISKVNKENA
jgi:primosomal protein N'